MADIRVTGAEDFLALSKRLKAEGKGELRKELNKGMRVGAKPLVAETRGALRAGLPSSGGLNTFMARKPMRIKVATGGTPGVSVVSKIDPRVDAGRIAHKTFGHAPIVQQRIPAGLFSKTLEREAPAVRKELVKAIETMQRRVYGRGGI